MATQTDEFYERIRKSHSVVSYVELIAPDQEAQLLKVLEGEVLKPLAAEVPAHEPSDDD